MEILHGKKPITKEDFITMMAEVTELKNLMMGYQNTKNKSNNSNIFDEVQQKNNEGKI
ncbi:hypothetical protein [Anaerocolumna sp. MB42-C2]|uniref:hypothetical protein n=1 Tax=Anaerocolumna sp. MB42-C2 TaxID=3070997 RepID=UPI0027DF51C6|nr:hypothetical protein [Anaerocolumna sp. MB42-C2]WMJ89197.1 hypothetical protein RBU59_06635 [Anaerocolumna sp. MB42-C2]